MNKRKEFQQVWYPVLILLLLAALFVYKNFSPYADFSLNLATEIIGILLTILLVDRVLRKQHAQELEEYQRLALKKLKIPLLHHLQLLQSIYKASAPAKQGKAFESIEKFLTDDDVYKEITYFDDQKDAPVIPQRAWRIYLIQEVDRFKNQVNQVADKYAAFVKPELLDMLEDITDSWFTHWISLRPAVEASDKQLGLNIRRPMFPVVNSEGVEKPAEMVRQHSEKLLLLLQYYNDSVSEKDAIKLDSGTWRADVSPVYGSARLEL